MRSFAWAVLAMALVVLGVLGCAFGGLILVSIPRSDTATWSLILFGLEFVVPGLALVAVGAWLLLRTRAGTMGS